MAKECGYQMTVTYNDGGRTDRTSRSKEWSGYGAVDHLLQMVKDLQRERSISQLKSIEIRVNIK